MSLLQPIPSIFPKPTTVDGIVAVWPLVLQAQKRLEEDQAKLVAAIARAVSQGVSVPASVRRAAGETSAILNSTRGKIIEVSEAFKVGAARARSVWMLSADDEKRLKGVGLAGWPLALAIGGAVVVSMGIVYNQWLDAQNRQKVVAVWEEQNRAIQATNPGAPLSPMPNVPQGGPGWLESNTNAVGNAAKSATSPLLLVGLFAAFYLFSKESKKRKEATAT